jgi:predicted membrane-bound spermidine synthase
MNNIECKGFVCYIFCRFLHDPCAAGVLVVDEQYLQWYEVAFFLECNFQIVTFVAVYSKARFYKLIYLVSFLEGAALMAAEIISAKLMAPFYGSSLIVWTSVFTVTLLGLAVGYFLGAKISTTNQLVKKLFMILILSLVLFAFMRPVSQSIMSLTLSLSLELGSLVSVFTILFPLLVCFGIVSPVVIKILSETSSQAGEKSGKVYTISTVGGILATILFGLYIVPDLGIKSSVFIGTSLTVLAMFITFYLYKLNIKNG